MNIHDEARTVEALNTSLVNQNRRNESEISRLRKGIAETLEALAQYEEVVWFNDHKTLPEHLNGLLNPSTPEKRGECPLIPEAVHV